MFVVNVINSCQSLSGLFIRTGATIQPWLRPPPALILRIAIHFYSLYYFQLLCQHAGISATSVVGISLAVSFLQNVHVVLCATTLLALGLLLISFLKTKLLPLFLSRELLLLTCYNIISPIELKYFHSGF